MVRTQIIKNMRTHKIETAAGAEAKQTIAVLVTAFASDPAVRWIYPNPNDFLTCFPEFAAAFGGGAFHHGTAHYVEGFRAGALWLPPGAHPDEEALLELFARSVPESRRSELMTVFEQMDSFHPSAPHWHLPLIGVDPTEQNQGLGSALLQHALQACDKANELAYLESSNARNIPLYQRHGFELMGEIRVGSCPPIFPMTRQPRVTSTTSRMESAVRVE